MTEKLVKIKNFKDTNKNIEMQNFQATGGTPAWIIYRDKDYSSLNIL